MLTIKTIDKKINRKNPISERASDKSKPLNRKVAKAVSAKIKIGAKITGISIIPLRP